MAFFFGDSARKYAEAGFTGEGFLLLNIDLETERFSVGKSNENQYVGEVKNEYSISADNYKTSIKDLFTTIIEYQIVNLKSQKTH